MLPAEVVDNLARACVDCEGSGLSLFELGHRTKLFGTVLDELIERVRRTLNVPDGFDVLFSPGGGTMQFSAVPLNLCTQGCRGAYVVTGHWSRAAYSEANRITSAYLLWNGGNAPLPTARMEPARGTDFVFYCDNETIDGKEFPTPPELIKGDAALVADMSSNILSRPIDWSLHDVVFSSLQKNLGTAGASLIVVRRDLYGSISERTPALLNWQKLARAGSMPNTPPVVALYTALLMLRWLEREGGVAVMAERALERSSVLYRALDAARPFYTAMVSESVRSRMNVVFDLPTERLRELFIAEASQKGLKNLAGHRTRGGIRASLYNAMPVAGAQALASFITEFAKRHA